jgi:phage pi2 protein 07
MLWEQNNILREQDNRDSKISINYLPQDFKWVPSLEVGGGLVFYYLSAFEIWPHKMGGLSSIASADKY